MKQVWLSVISLLMLVIISGCGTKEGISKTLFETPKPESVNTSYQDGTIVSNRVIMVGDTYFPGSGASIVPGVIVKLNSGAVVQVILGNSTEAELKGYSYDPGEKVRCKTQSNRRYTNDAWNLVPLEEK